MKKFLAISIVFALCLMAFSFVIKPKIASEEIKWMTWAEMQEAQKVQPRKVFVDVYTEWCGWCKKMDGSTFTHPEIVKYVNQNFYAIKFDAETKQTIKFNGKDYNFVAQGNRGYNELAADILNNRMSYPTGVYLDESLNEIFPVPGYLEPKSFEQVINYVNSNSYKTMQWDQYISTFKGKIK